nr:MAG TPA: hypothetical protein [Caudoviricetes sp.]
MRTNLRPIKRCIIVKALIYSDIWKLSENPPASARFSK